MEKINNKKAFTLIELLVVITIIGILAVGAVSVFTTQLQGARDSTRISDLKLMETAAHQIFSDEGQYPVATSFQTDITPFISKTLSDPKQGLALCWADDTNNNQTCQGYYNSFDDDFGLALGAFKLGVYFEKETNYQKKAKLDGGNVAALYEVYAGAGASSGAILDTDTSSGSIVY